MSGVEVLGRRTVLAQHPPRICCRTCTKCTSAQCKVQGQVETGSCHLPLPSSELFCVLLLLLLLPDVTSDTSKHARPCLPCLSLLHACCRLLTTWGSACRCSGRNQTFRRCFCQSGWLAPCPPGCTCSTGMTTPSHTSRRPSSSNKMPARYRTGKLDIAAGPASLSTL